METDTFFVTIRTALGLQGRQLAIVGSAMPEIAAWATFRARSVVFVSFVRRHKSKHAAPAALRALIPVEVAPFQSAITDAHTRSLCCGLVAGEKNPSE